MSLIDIRLPNFSADLVAILDSGFGQAFPSARPFKMAYMPSSKLMEHPIEDGSMIVDHKVDLPIELEATLIISSVADYRSTVSMINQSRLRGDLFTVQGKATSYRNMVISDTPYDEIPEMFDSILVVIRFKEARFVVPSFGSLPPRKVANKANADTKKAGAKQPSSTQTVVPSKAYDGFINGRWSF
jgi:hypothetical protein